MNLVLFLFVIDVHTKQRSIKHYCYMEKRVCICIEKGPTR